MITLLFGLVPFAAAATVVAAARATGFVRPLGPGPDPDPGTNPGPSGDPGPPPPTFGPNIAPRGPRRAANLPPWSGSAAVGSVAIVATLTFGVGAGLLLVSSMLGGRALIRRLTAARLTAARDRALPDLVDLFAVAASAGHPVHRCVAAVAPRAPAVLAPHMARAIERLEVGFSLRDVLASLGEELGPLGTNLTDVLSASLVTGAPLGPALVEVAATARDHRRREAEIVARKLPVQLLLPLVCCILPAFALLAVVPLLAGSLGALDPTS